LASVIRSDVAAHFDDHVFSGGLTYNSHPLGVAAALGTLQAYREDEMVGNARRLGPVLNGHLERMVSRHACAGASRSIGLFGCLDLVDATGRPLAAFNTTSPLVAELGRFLFANGVYTMLRWQTLMTNPPLCVTEAQLDEG